MLAVWLFFWLGKLLSRQKKERTWTFMSRLFKDSDSSSFSPLPPSPFPVREHLAKLNKSSARPWRNALTGLCREAQRHKGKLWSSGHPQGGREVKRASTGGRLGEKGAPSCPVTLLFRGWNRGNLEAVLVDRWPNCYHWRPLRITRLLSWDKALWYSELSRAPALPASFWLISDESVNHSELHLIWKRGIIMGALISAINWIVHPPHPLPQFICESPSPHCDRIWG